MASEPKADQLRVLIVGAGLSGLCLANALIRDERYHVSIFERDDLAYSSDRGGYQIRIAEQGISGLRECLDPALYQELKKVWGDEIARAPAIVDPIDLNLLIPLAKSAIYPRSRAVPRSALKDALLRLPLTTNALHLSKKLTGSRHRKNTETGRTEVIVNFQDGTEYTGDLLIAADGAGSLLNKIYGINNLMKFTSNTSVAGRGNISEEDYQKMPEVFRKHGSMMFKRNDCDGWFSIYQNTSSGAKPFLMWGFGMPGAEGEKKMGTITAAKTDQEKCDAAVKTLLEFGCKPEGLPAIVRHGPNGVRHGGMTTSRPPGDWRKGDAALGRVIFIGDAIHAMTPGRGQGANTALRDAADLLSILSPAIGNDAAATTDETMLRIAKDFDEVMYPRAFEWVKASENAGDWFVNTWSGWLYVWLGFPLECVYGRGLTLLEYWGLRRSRAIEW